MDEWGEGWMVGREEGRGRERDREREGGRLVIVMHPRETDCLE